MTSCDMHVSPEHEIGQALFSLHCVLTELKLLQRDFPELVARDYHDLLEQSALLDALCYRAQQGMKEAAE